MSYELFMTKTTEIVNRMGFSVKFSTDGKVHTANVSDGTIITGEADGNMVSFILPGGKTLKTAV